MLRKFVPGSPSWDLLVVSTYLATIRIITGLPVCGTHPGWVAAYSSCRSGALTTTEGRRGGQTQTVPPRATLDCPLSALYQSRPTTHHLIGSPSRLPAALNNQVHHASLAAY